jgi:hypothetical protein
MNTPDFCRKWNPSEKEKSKKGKRKLKELWVLSLIQSSKTRRKWSELKRIKW